MRYIQDENITRTCVIEIRFSNTVEGIFVVTFPSLWSSTIIITKVRKLQLAVFLRQVK